MYGLCEYVTASQLPSFISHRLPAPPCCHPPSRMHSPWLFLAAPPLLGQVCCPCWSRLALHPRSLPCTPGPCPACLDHDVAWALTAARPGVGMKTDEKSCLVSLFLLLSHVFVLVGSCVRICRNRTRFLSVFGESRFNVEFIRT